MTLPIGMRDWESGISLLFFSVAALLGAFALFQIALLPFRFGVDAKAQSPSSLSHLETPPLRPIEVYQNNFATHTLFSEPTNPVLTEDTGTSEGLAQYALMGIVQGTESEALIGDQLTSQTHFVRAGEQFGKFTLIQIKSHSVVVGYGGQRKEIFVDEGSIR